jgi:hypothetical protein
MSFYFLTEFLKKFFRVLHETSSSWLKFLHNFQKHPVLIFNCLRIIINQIFSMKFTVLALYILTDMLFSKEEQSVCTFRLNAHLKTYFMRRFSSTSTPKPFFLCFFFFPQHHNNNYTNKL